MSRLAALGWLVVLVGCSRADSPARPEAVAAAVDAAAPEAGPPSAPATPDESKLAWTDAPLVDRLAKDCKYVPVSATGKDGLLSCSGKLFYQACVADPCYTENQGKCMPRCEKACTSCDATCTTGCEACKAKCAAGDAACAKQCATTCAGCKQECLAAKDRCGSGTCGAEYTECAKKIPAAYKATGCPKACPIYYQCLETCRADAGYAMNAMEKCQPRCAPPLEKVCPEPYREMCTFTGRGPDEPMTNGPSGR